MTLLNFRGGAPAIAPANTVAPVISGNVQVGQTLSATTGTWANNPTSYSYQWKRNGVNISAATNSTYVLIVDDAGNAGPITCFVTATNAYGSSSPTSSNELQIDVYIVALASITDTSDATTYNGAAWQGVTFGTAAANRKLVLGVGARSGTSNLPTISAMSIGGNAATVHAYQEDPDAGTYQGAAIGSANVTTGTSGDLSITFGGGQARAGGVLYAVYGANDTVFQIATMYSDNRDVYLGIPPGGVAIAYSFGNVATAAWTTMTEYVDEAVESTINHSSAYYSSAAGGLFNCKVNWTTLTTTQPQTAYVVFRGLKEANDQVLVQGAGRSWWNNDSTIVINGELWAGGVTLGSPNIANGSIVVGRTGITPVVIKSASLVDDHEDPSLLRRSSDNKILAAYGKHNDVDEYYTALSTNADDMTAWGTPVNIHSSVGGAAKSYANLLENDDGIYNLFRNNTNTTKDEWHYSISTDDGATWASAQRLVIDPADQRPYSRFTKNGARRLDFTNNEGNPDEGPITGNDLYHFYFDGTNWRQSDGTDMGSPPFAATAGTQVYATSADDDATWAYDIQIMSGAPVIVFARLLESGWTDHRYYYAKWSGSAWVVNQICTAGGSMSSTPTAAGLRTYSGGICIDPDDPNTIYCSRDTSGVFQLWRGVTADSGANWTLTQLTFGTTHCYRPSKLASSPWVTYMAGTYETWDGVWDTSIAGLRVA